MKLYYSPGACSLAPHIVAEEAGILLDLEKVDIRAKRTEHGSDYLGINPKGSVPALLLDDGGLLTEGPVISQYLADQKPEADLVPHGGSMEHYRMLEILGFINSEIHKTYGPLFNPATSTTDRDAKIALLMRKYELIGRLLEGQRFLVADKYSIADAYLFTVTSWAVVLKVDLSRFPRVLNYQARIAERPAVQVALRSEGLIGA